ncbi:ABC transporter substrate-binding protein [Roseomonas sp. NAR14]|uniref:ABC transporter substrate-binding protein n=1 Tax=Roseomonas acroporae TaxID=2937791 RepID=A0A9X2BTF1_9PROT|nr:ABC transporter substrate-binding protein [Roseomonas acroporae]MCK8784242.1 ABC transporter substrate-binding protein [Roseomonas acroporae]
MSITRRSALGAALGTMAAGATTGVRAQRADGAGAQRADGAGAQRADGATRRKLKLGIITDLAGPYADLNRPSMACAQQALEDFDVAGRGWDVEILLGQHFDKADNAVTIARHWFDQEGVDAVLDVNTSATSLAVAGIAREKNRPLLLSGPGTAELTGRQCSPNTVHWTWDTYMLAKSSGTAMVRRGGTSWYFVAADYSFGQQLVRDTRAVVEGQGGRVLGSAFYPFPSTTDFSSMLLRAKASGAGVLALGNAGADLINTIKQAHEFGVNRGMSIVSLLTYDTDVRVLGLEVAQGLMTTQAYYWDLNDRTRAFNARVRPKTPALWPNMANAGIYAATLHYLKALADMGFEQRADGAAVVARMKAMPTDDDCFGPGRIREDGRKLHPAYLMQVKTPAESRDRYDVLKLLATVAPDEAFRPLREGGCPFVRT